MAELAGSQTHENLKAAFAGASPANRRYLYYAKIAEAEVLEDVAANFRSTALGETGHAPVHPGYLPAVGDPTTCEPIGTTAQNLQASITAETHEYTEMYPAFAKTARDEGLDDIADWFEILAKAEKSHAGRFEQMLDSLG